MDRWRREAALFEALAPQAEEEELTRSRGVLAGLTHGDTATGDETDTALATGGTGTVPGDTGTAATTAGHVGDTDTMETIAGAPGHVGGDTAGGENTGTGGGSSGSGGGTGGSELRAGS
jgi:hypothetical protein